MIIPTRMIIAFFRDGHAEMANHHMTKAESETDLSLSIANFFTFTARHCQQELSLIPLGVFQRTVNGTLHYLTHGDTYKLRTVIRCHDANLPAFQALRPGVLVEVGCIATLTQLWPIEDTTMVLEHQPVSGSVLAWRASTEVPVHVNGKQLTFDKAHHAIDKDARSQHPILVSYRPQLSMVLTNFKTIIEEWNVRSMWEMTLEEA